MGVCYTQECIHSYLLEKEIYYRGNKIFKHINTRLNTNNLELTPEEALSLENCMKLLEESEKTRIEIAKKFENFLYNTGACVLTQPTIERGLITYIINFLTQIIICAKKKSVKFNIKDFSLNDFIIITNSSPFIKINQKTLDSLNNKYGFDFNKIEILIKGKDSIIDFLSSVPKTKTLLEKQVEILKNLSMNYISNFFMLKQISNSIDGILFLIYFFKEIYNGIVDTQIQLTKPSKIELFYKIANEAAEKEIKDPKELALLYAIGDNCGKVENWKENMTYRELEQVKY